MKVSKKYFIWTLIFSVIALAINAFIIVHSCLDATTSTEASHGVVEIAEEVINTVAPGTITPDNHDSFVSFIRKAFGHFGLFLISGFFTSLALFLTHHFGCSIKRFITCFINGNNSIICSWKKRGTNRCINRLWWLSTWFQCHLLNSFPYY